MKEKESWIRVGLVCMVAVVVAVLLSGCASTGSSQWIWKADFNDKAAVEIVVMVKDIDRASLAGALTAGMEGWGAAELATITPWGYVAVTGIRAVFNQQERKSATQRLRIMEGEVGGIIFIPSANKLSKDIVVVLMKENCTPEHLDKIVQMVKTSIGEENIVE
ncbi:MAG: hypothetical protein KKH94_06520 [Candidatus Omnitrophica bacterium]|nr:hypothetical protein [Candidatus Omnitrophota bacterium]